MHGIIYGFYNNRPKSNNFFAAGAAEKSKLKQTAFELSKSNDACHAMLL